MCEGGNTPERLSDECNDGVLLDGEGVVVVALLGFDVAFAGAVDEGVLARLAALLDAKDGGE